MRNAADRKDIRRAEKLAKLESTHDRETIVILMSTINGRSWMWRQLEQCHCFNDPFTGDALHEAYQKGERNFGLRLLSQINLYCPDQYIQMVREANERYLSNNRDPDDAATSAEYSGGEESGRVVEGREPDAESGDYHPYN